MGWVLVVEGLVVMLVHAAGWLPSPSGMPPLGPWFQVNDSYRVFWAVWAGGVALAILGATALWPAGPRSQRVGWCC